jgi:predicted nucleic-acid-binding protein
VIALDTNILLRYLVQDDPVQGDIATRVLETELTPDVPGFVTIVAVLELDWVLRGQYGFSPTIVADTLRALLQSQNLVFEERMAIENALAFEFGDLADRILHASSQNHGCSKTIGFDRKFSRLSGVELLTE